MPLITFLDVVYHLSIMVILGWTCLFAETPRAVTLAIYCGAAAILAQTIAGVSIL